MRKKNMTFGLGFSFFIIFQYVEYLYRRHNSSQPKKKKRREKNEGGRKLSEFVDHDLSCESANNPRRLVVLFSSLFPFFCRFSFLFLGGNQKNQSMTYELFSVGDKYIQGRIGALFLLTGSNRRRTKTGSAQGRHLFNIFHPFYYYFFFVVLLFRCNSRRFCFRTVMNDLFFFYSLDKLLLGYIFHPPVLVVFLPPSPPPVFFQSSCLDFFSRPSCVSSFASTTIRQSRRQRGV